MCVPPGSLHYEGFIRKIACHSARTIRCLAGWVSSLSYPFQMQGCLTFFMQRMLWFILFERLCYFVQVSRRFCCWHRCLFWVFNRCYVRTFWCTHSKTFSSWPQYSWFSQTARHLQKRRRVVKQKAHLLRRIYGYLPFTTLLLLEIEWPQRFCPKPFMRPFYQEFRLKKSKKWCKGYSNITNSPNNIDASYFILFMVFVFF